MTDAQSGYLLLADISGYKAFLSDSELEHARDTLTDLLGLLIDHAKTPLVLSKLEGDAVFSYTWGEKSFKDGQTLVELIENTYVALRRAIDLMVMNSTCQCAACANVRRTTTLRAGPGTPRVGSMIDEQRRSIIGIASSLAVGALVVLAGSAGSRSVGPIAVFAVCGLIAYAINWAVFVPSNRAQTEHYFDLTGSVTYLTVTAVALALSGDLDARAIIVGLMVWIWAARLGSFLFRRVRRDGRDGRFDRIKTDPLQFFMTWTLQGLWVLLTLAAALAIITGTERQPIGWVAIVGIAVWVVGFAVESVADRQKSAFRRNPENEGRFITSGLWAWSRHPNYFGEIVLWTGIAIMAVPVLSGWRWITLISPVFVVLLLTRVSGIPMLEARAEKRWGGEAPYEEYVSRTPVLIPRAPRT